MSLPLYYPPKWGSRLEKKSFLPPSLCEQGIPKAKHSFITFGFQLFLMSMRLKKGQRDSLKNLIIQSANFNIANLILYVKKNYFSFQSIRVPPLWAFFSVKPLGYLLLNFSTFSANTSLKSQL